MMHHDICQAQTITALRMGIKDDGVSFHLNLVGEDLRVPPLCFLCYDGCVVEDDARYHHAIERTLVTARWSFRKITRLTQLRSFAASGFTQISWHIDQSRPGEDRNQILVQLIRHHDQACFPTGQCCQMHILHRRR